ncbi:MAG TPA: hypothetical protein PKA05_13370 [Roseiflexaceae bacterium]|nr:hypothetical protein [Roseiflexaceae bacterium]HMP41367.1 hypothetical protein [Roseiflexaceae bacterium]
MNDEKAARLIAIRAAKAAGTGTSPPAAPQTDFADLPPAMAPHTLIALLLSAVAGALGAVVVLPLWLPGLTASLIGKTPHAYWFLARSSALVAYGLLWISMIFGLLMSNRLARAWPGGPTAFELHQHTSLLGLTFALFHGVILLGDRFIQASLWQILVPFAYTGFAPFWVGLGQIALYGLALVGLSFYIKDRIGRTMWRLIHFVSFAVFVLALVHGIASGSDSAMIWMRGFYWFSGGSVLFLTIYRILVAWKPRALAV